MFKWIINSYLHHVFERKCTNFCLKHFSYSIHGHMKILGVKCTPRVSFRGARGNLRIVVFPTPPRLTNSRGDTSIQGVINVYSTTSYSFTMYVCRVTLVMEDLQCMFMVTPPLDVWRRDAVRIGMASCRLGRFSNEVSWDSIGRCIGRGSSSLLRCCKNHCSVLSLVPRLSSLQAEGKTWYQPNNESAPIPNGRCTVVIV